uniref:uncharacterized protein isoform X2 n=1 Tax=Myxine glutinosa TaxID=7769 RepID=UPI00358E7C18
MFPWIILFLTVPISQGLITSIGPSPGENVTINCTLSVLPDEIGLISIRWMWTPADEFAEIKILVHYGRSVIQTYDNTRFSNRLIVVDGNTDDGNVSLLLTNITSLDSGIFTCVDKSDSPYRVISQTKLSVRLPERRETEACHTGNAVPFTIIAFLVVINVVLIVYVVVSRKIKFRSHVSQNSDHTAVPDQCMEEGLRKCVNDVRTFENVVPHVHCQKIAKVSGFDEVHHDSVIEMLESHSEQLPNDLMELERVNVLEKEEEKTDEVQFSPSISDHRQ